ncbi:MAG TPA: FdhF/YdeP family oxidoreductase [Bacteroidetes bacterium]|nr:FdhF/YdeP family oxidoreductase [Bacteroidota bacterium]
MNRNVSIIPPEETSNLRIGVPARKAAGIKGIQKSVDKVREELGVLDGMLLLQRMNQKDGFDCPSCAWPDPDGPRSAIAEYCENGAKALADEATSKRIGRKFFVKYSVEELSRKSDHWLGLQGRLTKPMILKEDSIHYEPIDWEDAFDLIASKLYALSEPNEAVFYTSGRTSNEAAFLYQLLARQLGTNNLPDCSNMCHESSGVGLGETLGIGKGSVTLEDFEKAEVVIVIGQNPGTNHPRMMGALKRCKDRGGKIVTVNPILETGNIAFVDPKDPWEIAKGGTRLNDHFLQVRINGDVALLKAIMKMLWEKEKFQSGSVFDLDFINNKTEGFYELLAELDKQDLDMLVKDCGVYYEEIKKVVNLLAVKKRIIICWAMGLTQHVNGVDNIKEIVNLLLLKGSIGKPGAGTCPVRGHSNVQGDRTVGIIERPKESFLHNLDDRFGISSPREHGYNVVETIDAMNKNKVRIFISMGGNFISATPDSELTGNAMMNCDLSVQVSTKLNRSHLVTGKTALILPCLGRSERDEQKNGDQFVSVENSMGVVHKSRGRKHPSSRYLKSEVAIVSGIGNALNKKRSGIKIEWSSMPDNYDIIRDHIESCIPGFENYNQRLREPGGFYLPNCNRDQEFNTPDKKALFTINPLPKHELEAGEYVLMTIRSHDQFNTTIYGMDDRYRGIYNERRIVLMNPDDMIKEGLKKKERINMISCYNGEERKANNFIVVPYKIAEGCIASYFPETNVLVPLGLKARKSDTPASKYIVVSFEKVID